MNRHVYGHVDRHVNRCVYGHAYRHVHRHVNRRVDRHVNRPVYGHVYCRDDGGTDSYMACMPTSRSGAMRQGEMPGAKG